MLVGLSSLCMKNDDDDENNDKSEDIKNGLLNDFNDLIFFGFSENPFKAPNLSSDRRFKTVFTPDTQNVGRRVPR